MSVNQIPVCVHTSAYQGWAISVECDKPSTDAPESYQFATYRNGVIAEKCGFTSLTDALNAAIAQVDSDVLWHKGYLIAQSGQPLLNDAIAAGHQAAVEAGNLIAA